MGYVSVDGSSFNPLKVTSDWRPHRLKETFQKRQKTNFFEQRWIMWPVWQLRIVALIAEQRTKKWHGINIKTEV